MPYEKPTKDTYYGLPLEYRIENRRYKGAVHETLILSYRAAGGGTLNYEHPPRRVKNWSTWQKSYQTLLHEHPEGPAKTFLESLPEEIMRDFCEGFAGMKAKQRGRKRND